MDSSVDIEKLYHTYYMDVYSYMMTLAKDAHMAEEITQEVFFKALKTRHPCNGASGELTWLCAIAKNTFMDECRRQARLRKTDEELPDETSLEKGWKMKRSPCRSTRSCTGWKNPIKKYSSCAYSESFLFRK